MSEWLPIETAPHDGTPIIALLDGFDKDPYCEISILYYSEEDEDGPDGWYDSYGENYTPTYWMPYPPTPKKKHKCETESIVCTTNSDGKLQISVYYEDVAEVNFCPICGEKAGKDDNTNLKKPPNCT